MGEERLAKKVFKLKLRGETRCKTPSTSLEASANPSREQNSSGMIETMKMVMMINPKYLN